MRAAALQTNQEAARGREIFQYYASAAYDAGQGVFSYPNAQFEFVRKTLSQP
jgi:hypothetical protein